MTQTTNNGWQQAIYQNTKALDGLEVKVDTLNEKVSNIETDVSQLKTDISELTSDMSEVKGRLREIEELLKWLKWIAGGVVTIALALVANFLSSFIIH